MNMPLPMLLLPAALLLQTPQFEVASIRVAEQDGNHSSHTTKGLMRMHNLSAKTLIMRAYNVREEEISGAPDWAGSLGFDITAKIPEEFVDNQKDTVPAMLQQLLAERFHLVIHREAREASGYRLIVTKKGAKLAAAKDSKNSSTNVHNTHMIARNVSMDQLARFLTGQLEKIVADETGLKDGFDFELDWSDDVNHDANADKPSLFTALQEQLGLKVESAKVPYSAVVIDRLEKPEQN